MRQPMNSRYRGDAAERAELRGSNEDWAHLIPTPAPLDDSHSDLMEGPTEAVYNLLALQNTPPTHDLREAVVAALAVIDAGGVDRWPERSTRNQDALAEAQRQLARGEQRDELAKICSCLGAGGFPPLMHGSRGIWHFRFCSCEVGRQAESVCRAAQAQYEADRRAAQQRLEEGYRKDRLEKFVNSIPPHFANMTLETFPAATAGARRVQAEIANWAEAAYPENPFLFLHGPYGAGKTALALGAARRRVGLGYAHKVIFTAVPDLLDRLKATMDRDGPHERYDDVMEKLRNCDLLILDDIGAENCTPWAVERLFVLLNHRHGEMAHTIITSNLDGKGLAERLGERSMWRVAEAAQVVSMAGCPNLRGRRSTPKLEVVNA